MSEVPEIGEVVICKITKVMSYGVFVELLEFPGLTGFVHISHVASSWIKNIRNFVREGQIRAAEVIRIDTQKNQIDLSFTKISSQTQKEKLEEYRQSKRTRKLIELLGEEKKKDFEEVWEKVALPLIEEYDYLYKAFETIAVKKEEALPESLPKEWIKPLLEMVEKNVPLPQKTLKAEIELHSYASNGVELIKKALITGQKAGGKQIEMIYEGSGKFLVKSTATDYKKANKNLQKVCETAVKEIKKLKGTGIFTIINKKGHVQTV